jgi:hypothetical protein
VSATFVVVDHDTLDEAVMKARRPDRIITAYPDGETRPLLGFSASSGKWHVALWSMTQPCGTWTVGADGKAACRVPAEGRP